MNHFYVLKAAQADYQIGRRWLGHDEVAVTQKDGMIYTRGHALAHWLRINGFNVVIDPTGEMAPSGLTRKQVAEVLDIPTGAVAKMVEHGKLRTYEFPEPGFDLVFDREQVAAVAHRRMQEEYPPKPEPKKLAVLASSVSDDKGED